MTSDYLRHSPAATSGCRRTRASRSTPSRTRRSARSRRKRSTTAADKQRPRRGHHHAAHGLAAEPMYTPELVAGNWYSDAQARTSAACVVIGEALADKARVEGRRTIRSRPRPDSSRSGSSGTTATPRTRGGNLPAARHAAGGLRSPGEINSYWISTTTQDHADDRPDHRARRGRARRGRQPVDNHRALRPEA